MLTWQKVVEKYITKYSNKIQKSTKPLHEHLGINYFTYHRVDKNGKYTVLVDRPDWAEYYVENQFFLSDPYMRHPDVYESGTCVWGLHGSEEYKSEIIKAIRKFNMTDSLTIIKKDESSVEFFGFAGNRKNCNFQKLNTNYHSLLYSFTNYFRKEMNSILKNQSQEAISLPETKGEDFYLQTPITPNIDNKQIQSFLTDIGLKKECQQANLLSKREKECLILLSQGKITKEIATQLNLSPRTVESYIENIRLKLNCWNKSDLILKAQHFLEINLIP